MKVYLPFLTTRKRLGLRWNTLAQWFVSDRVRKAASKARRRMVPLCVSVCLDDTGSRTVLPSRLRTPCSDGMSWTGDGAASVVASAVASTSGDAEGEGEGEGKGNADGDGDANGEGCGGAWPTEGVSGALRPPEKGDGTAPTSTLDVVYVTVDSTSTSTSGFICTSTSARMVPAPVEATVALSPTSSSPVLEKYRSRKP